LLGLLFVSGAKVRGAWATRLLDEIGGPTAQKLRNWLNQNAGKKVRVCTELVAGSFFRAADGKFALQVHPPNERPPAIAGAATDDLLAGLPSLGTDGDAAARGAPDPRAAELDALLMSCTALLTPPPPAAGSGASLRNLAAATIACTPQGKSVGIVTPADLEFSPSLQFVGRIRA
jgi:hypothetical protein